MRVVCIRIHEFESDDCGDNFDTGQCHDHEILRWSQNASFACDVM